MTLDESDEVIIVGFEIEITIDRIGLEFRHIVENVDMIVIFFRQFQTLFCFEVFYENENKPATEPAKRKAFKCMRFVLFTELSCTLRMFQFVWRMMK